MTQAQDGTTRERGRGVLEGAFALLDALRRCGGEAGLTEIAVACGLPKGSAHRLLDQLVLVGAVERHGGRYRVGCQLFRLGQAWQPHPGLRLAARHPLHRLRALTGASALMTVVHDGLALTVASVPGELEPVAPVRNGMSFGLETAAGQVLTAPPRAARRSAGRFTGRLAGVVLEREQVLDGVCCAALPVRAADGRLIGAVTAMVPPGRRLEAVAEEATRASAAITANLARAAESAANLPPILHH